MNFWNKYSTAIITVVSIIMVVVLGITFAQSFQNHAITLEESVETALSDIKVQEKRRFDLIPNLVDCVKQYDKHEAETLQAIVDGRSNIGENENLTKTIMMVAEAYPELKSNENYKQLMTELSTTENLIAQYRDNYNKQVGNYNRYVRKFWTRTFLGLTGYEVIDYERLDFNAPVDAPTNLFD